MGSDPILKPKIICHFSGPVRATEKPSQTCLDHPRFIPKWCEHELQDGSFRGAKDKVFGSPSQGVRGALKGHEAVVEKAVAEEAVVEVAVVEEAVEPSPGPPEPPPGPPAPPEGWFW